MFFFFNDTATTEIYTLSLHDALPIFALVGELVVSAWPAIQRFGGTFLWTSVWDPVAGIDRKSTRLNSSHSQISYAVFCLKKKKNKHRKYVSHVSIRGRCATHIYTISA